MKMRNKRIERRILQKEEANKKLEEQRSGSKHMKSPAKFPVDRLYETSDSRKNSISRK